MEGVGIKSIAVIGIYSPLDTIHHQEQEVQQILYETLGRDVDITLSHDVAGIGFLESENATVLNAAILPLARRTISQFQTAFEKLNIDAPL